MTEGNRGIRICTKGVDGKERCFKTDKKALEFMIRGYQEMGEINLGISKLCFGVESEADDISIRLTESE